METEAFALKSSRNKTQMPGSILNFNVCKGSSSEQKSYWPHMVHISTAQAEGGFV